ncbi:MAG: 4'-phosphopantetheinyl transferase superfamily protein, partial [Pseudomonadota bacterium]
HFAHARLALRRILSGYLKHPAEQIVFHYENNGRPGIAHPAADIDFNLSHTGNRMVLAVSQAFRVGVDIEVVRASPRHAAIARRFLTADDAERIARLDAASVPRAFARAWTRFEAARKLSGTGVFAAEPHSPPSRCIAFAIDDGIVGQLCHNAITRTDLVFLTPDGNLLGGTDSQQV